MRGATVLLLHCQHLLSLQYRTINIGTVTFTYNNKISAAIDGGFTPAAWLDGVLGGDGSVMEEANGIKDCRMRFRLVQFQGIGRRSCPPVIATRHEASDYRCYKY